MSDRLLRVEEARARILAGLEPVRGEERLAPEEALGRILAEPVVAANDLPGWDNSAMDGYAIRALDVAGATERDPVALRVVGEAAAGTTWDRPVEPGTAVRIATGAPLPAGADAVVQVEATTPLGADGKPSGPRSRDAGGPLPSSVAVHGAIAPGTAVRARGSDIIAGEVVLPAGAVLGPAGVALAAAARAGHVRVRRRPLIGVLATGDELRGPDEPLGPAGVPDSNGPALRAQVSAAGADVLDLGVGRDRLEDVEARLRRGIADADAIVVSGGVSVGPRDVVRLAFDALGRVDLWRVAIQPGKPFAFGHADRPGGGRPALLFGLPGNPVSAFVTFELFVRPAIRLLAGRSDLLRPIERGVLTGATTKSAGRRAYLRAVAEREPDGRPRRDAAGRILVRLAGGQGSHVLTALLAAEALAAVPEPLTDVPPGTEVELTWLDRP
jgi:molybdopterin molybdotransferase